MSKEDVLFQILNKLNDVDSKLKNLEKGQNNLRQEVNLLKDNIFNINEDVRNIEQDINEIKASQHRIESKLENNPSTYEGLEISIGMELQEHREILKDLTYTALKHDSLIKRIK